MRSFVIKPGDLIPIGRAGENQATEIRFDVTGWAETFGAGSYALVMRRPGEDTVYPITVTTDGEYVVWVVSNVDTGIVGNAQVQLRYTVDGMLAKSVIYRGIVGESLDNIVDPPDPYEDLIGQMVDLTERAEAAAESASGSAGTATTAAEAAQTAKTAAETAAGQAQSAKEAAQGSATTATQAKTAAQAAQTAAEDAKSAAAQSATAASGSATAAAGSAGQAAGSATAASGSAAAAAQSAAAAQAAAMNVIDKAPVIVDTASGAIASFPDGSNAPIKQLNVAVNPVQDLHGYDAPWPGGARKNILEGVESGTYSTNGSNNNSSTRLRSIGYVKVAPNTQYTFSATSTSGIQISVSYFTEKGTERTNSPSFVNVPRSFTTGANTEYIRFLLRYPDDSQISATDVTNAQVELGSTPTDYVPYSNICPITGWTGAEVYRTGFNIWDEQWESGAYNTTTGEKSSSSSQFRSKNLISVTPGATYYFKSPINCTRLVFGSNQAYLGRSATTWANQTFTVGDDTYYIVFYSSGGNPTYGNNISMNYPSTGHDYHAYTGASYPITWQSEAGTVYGGRWTAHQDGSVDVVAEWARIDLGTLTWTYSSDNGAFYGQGASSAKKWGFQNVICDSYATRASATGNNWTLQNGEIGGGNNSSYFYIKNTAYDNATALANSLLGVFAVYELATPVTYTLTAEEVTTLLGQNNVWANTGDVSVTYRADTRKFIEKKILEAVSALI